LFVGLVLGVRYVVRPGVEDHQIERPEVGEASIDRPEPAPPEPRRPDFVSIRIEGLPPRASITLDGLPAQAPLRVRRGSAHNLVISAPGYVDRHLDFTADQNRTLDADLRPAGP
jgi:hypothetical protein